MLDLKLVQEISISRAKRWHNGDINSWSTLEWAGAMAGEAGEACNAAKKLKRIEDKIKNINLDFGRNLTERSDAYRQVVQEVADTILYGVLVAASVGCVGDKFEAVVREVFNKKSEEYGFPEVL